MTFLEGYKAIYDKIACFGILLLYIVDHLLAENQKPVTFIESNRER